MSVKTLELPNIPIDDNSLVFAREIDSLPGVENVQLYPDCYTKQKYLDLDYKITVPSSSAIVSKSDVLYPQFRSRGIGCGMRAVALPLDKSELTETFIDDLMKALTYNPLYYAAYKLRLPWYPETSDLSYDKFISILEGDSLKINDVKGLLNTDWLTNRTVRTRRCFGRYFGGNHFFELLVAKSDSDDLSLKKNQIVALYHTGCQGLESLIRPDLAQKFFYQKKYVATRRGDEMYQAFFVAQEILLRYTYAFREATQNLLDSVLDKHLKEQSTYIIDNQHNSVTIDNYGNEDVLVYRHNAVNLKKGALGIISGMYDHESYLVEGGENIGTYYNTIDHGLGSVLDREVDKTPDVNAYVTLKKYKQGMSFFRKKDEKVKIKNSKNVASYFDLLREKKMAHVKVALEPLINLKYTR